MKDRTNESALWLFDGTTKVSLAEFVAAHRSWVHAPHELRRLVRSDATPPGLSERRVADHPVFGAWRADLEQLMCPRGQFDELTAPVTHATDSFIGGDVAFLDESEWPKCGTCQGDLEMCLQISEEEHRPWTNRSGSLVLLYCFDCRPRYSQVPELAFGQAKPAPKGAWLLRFVDPRCTVSRPRGVERRAQIVSQGAEADPRAWRRARVLQQQRIKAGPRAWKLPGLGWHEIYVTPDSAAKHLLFGGISVLADDESTEAGRQVGDEYEAYSSDKSRPMDFAKTATIPPDRLAIGGFPIFSAENPTVCCPICKKQMSFLLEVGLGAIFGRGALHVFICDRTEACERATDLQFDYTD